MVGQAPSLGWSPSNYKVFYRMNIWLSKILTGQKFGSQIALLDKLLKLNTYVLGLVRASLKLSKAILDNHTGICIPA